MKKHFLSLTEMLVVVGIIILLFSIGVPAVIKGMQKGELTECKGNLSQLGKAVSVYLKDNKNYFPSEEGYEWINQPDDPIAELMGDSYTTAIACPSDPNAPYDPNTDSQLSSYRASATDKMTYLTYYKSYHAKPPNNTSMSTFIFHKDTVLRGFLFQYIEQKK